VKSIVEQEGDYAITLKNNQPSLYARVEELFKQAIRQRFSGFTHTDYSTKKENNHGRLEIRYHLMLSDVKELTDPKINGKIHTIEMIKLVRIVKKKTTIKTRYYISDLPNNAQRFGKLFRSHWGIKKSLRWVLNVGFSEDDCRIKKDNVPQNFAILIHIFVNLLNQEKNSKAGGKNQRLRAGGMMTI
jgi:predicted transposase YbfD/YdcC